MKSREPHELAKELGLGGYGGFVAIRNGKMRRAWGQMMAC
jgi:hypothetical protein